MIFLALVFLLFCFFFFNDTATTEIYTLSLHDALPIIAVSGLGAGGGGNRVPEVYRSGLNWSALAASTFDWPLYAHLFLLRNGKLFYTGGNMGGGGLSPGIVLLPANTYTSVAPPAGFDLGHRDQAFSVLLPPAQDQ